MIATLFEWLSAAAWKGSALLLLTLVVVTLFRSHIPPRWRHALLLVAMLRLLVPVAPAAPFSVFNLAPAANQASELQVVRAELRSGGGPPLLRVMPRDTPRSTTRTRDIVAGLWLAGFAALMLRVGFVSYRLHRRVVQTESTPPGMAALHALLDACRDQLRIATPIRLRITGAVSSPSLHGVFRPTLLLPADLHETLTPDQVRFIFLHELAHFRRFDVLLNWLTTIAAALHWFNPLVWLAVTRVAEERELACDALALDALDRGERNAYGQTVIRLLDDLRGPALVPAAVGMATTRHQAKRRIQMIATFRKESRRAAWFAVAVAAIALATLTDASAGERGTRKRVMVHKAAEHAYIQQLEGIMSTQFASASVEDVVRAVSTSAGVAIKFADGVLTDEIRNARIKLDAKDIPAHVVLAETLASFDLAIQPGDDGIVSIVKAPEGVREVRVLSGENEERFVVKQGDKAEVRVMRKAHDEAAASSTEKRIHRRIEVDAQQNTIDGTIRRKVKFTGDNDVQGTLDIEITK